ncbi:MAG: phosphatase PAP2 family protein [Acidobacteriota bacterium]
MDVKKEINQTERNYLLIYSIAITFCAIAFIYWFVPGLDKDILVAHNPVFHNDLLLNALKILTDAGIPILLLICSAFFYFFTGGKNREGENIKQLLIVLFTLFISGIMGDLIKIIVGRVRPVVELAGLIESSEMHRTLSFPSGHTAKIMGMVIPFITLSFINIKHINVYKGIVLFTGVMVAYSRIALQAHYPSDVMGGVAVAFLFFPVSAILAGKYVKKYGESKAKTFVIILLALAFILAFIEMSM